MRLRDPELTNLPFHEICQLPSVLATMFRDLLLFLEERQSLEDFHVDVVARKKSPGFRLSLLHNPKRKRQLKPRLACISCETDNVVAQASLLKTTRFNRCWIDAKARPFFIVTPLEHVETFTALTDEQLVAFYADGIDLLRSELEFLDATSRVELSQAFNRLTVNFGCYRNLAHLHLKIKMPAELFALVRAHWPADRIQQWQQIIQLSSDSTMLREYIGGEGHPQG